MHQVFKALNPTPKSSAKERDRARLFELANLVDIGTASQQEQQEYALLARDFSDEKTTLLPNGDTITQPALDFKVSVKRASFTGDNDGQVNQRYDEIGEFYDDIELKVNEFRKAFVSGGPFEKWNKPEEAIFIEIYPDDISRINEQNSSLRISGTIKAYWHPEKSIKTIYPTDGPLTKDLREDV